MERVAQAGHVQIYIKLLLPIPYRLEKIPSVDISYFAALASQRVSLTCVREARPSLTTKIQIIVRVEEVHGSSGILPYYGVK